MSSDRTYESAIGQDRIQRLERRLSRETNARREAERLLEEKSLELFNVNRNLIHLNACLEQRVEERTQELEKERRRAEEQAHRDPLTGLPNRLMFRKHMQKVTCCVEAGCCVAVLYLDLDGFKAVNDTLGHPVGDELLRAVAARLQDNVCGNDLIARIGGDEFVIVQLGTQQPAMGIKLAERLTRALQAPFSIQSHRILTGTSIGVACSAVAIADADSLLRNADIALYVAKAEGRGTWRAFEAAMDQQMQARRRLEIQLHTALADKQFEVFYQPLMQAMSNDLAGFEALLRWNHPERGSVSPGEFIPLAEETKLIKPLGAWVLEPACRDAAKWPTPLKVAVNLSPVQFIKGNLVEEVRNALTVSKLTPGRLELEITESVLLQNSDETLKVLSELRHLGVQISMDDFGTGYSSLSYLRKFPFDKIKIDQSFVRSLADGKGSLEIVRAVVGLGRALSMKVLAEGVETSDQLTALRAEGCDEVQGYLFSKPVPLAEAWRTITLAMKAKNADVGHCAGLGDESELESYF